MKDDTLWLHFSRYIRLRDSDENGICTCFTCGARQEWNSGGMQAGHFISRRHWATRYHLQNVHAQCVSCNHFNGGRQYEYALKLDAVYGAGTAAGMFMASKCLEKYTQAEINALQKYYLKASQELAKEKGIKI